MYGSQMFMFGGFGGGADFYALDTGILDEQKLERDPNRRRKRGNAAAGDTGFGNWLLPGDVGPQLGRVACASP